VQYSFLLPNLRGKSRCTPLFLYGRSFKGLIALRAEDSYTPTLQSQLAQRFSGDGFHSVPISFNFFSVKTKRCSIFFLSSNELVVRNFFHYCIYIVLLHGTVDTIFFNFRRLLPLTFAEVLNINEHSLHNNTFLQPLSMTEHMPEHASHIPALIKVQSVG
jgi:hypothetical protein